MKINIRLSLTFILYAMLFSINIIHCSSGQLDNPYQVQLPDDPRVLDNSDQLQQEAHKPILSKKMACCLTSIPISIALFWVVFSQVAIKDRTPSSCVSAALDSNDNLTLSDWHVEIDGCESGSSVLSPIYCPADVSVQQINDIVQQTLPSKSASAVCALKANATANNQTCIDFAKSSDTLTQTAQQCDRTQPNKKSTIDWKKVVAQVSEAKGIARFRAKATHHRRLSRKQQFNSGR